jgi:hypothetical protein
VIVNEYADVHQVGHFAHGNLKSLLGVVSGHYDRDALAIYHFEG